MSNLLDEPEVAREAEAARLAPRRRRRSDMTAFSTRARPKASARVILFRLAPDRGVDPVGRSSLPVAVARASRDERPTSERAPPESSE